MITRDAAALAASVVTAAGGASRLREVTGFAAHVSMSGRAFAGGKAPAVPVEAMLEGYVLRREMHFVTFPRGTAPETGAPMLQWRAGAPLTCPEMPHDTAAIGCLLHALHLGITLPWQLLQEQTKIVDAKQCRYDGQAAIRCQLTGAATAVAWLDGGASIIAIDDEIPESGSALSHRYWAHQVFGGVRVPTLHKADPTAQPALAPGRDHGWVSFELFDLRFLSDEDPAHDAAMSSGR